MKESKRKGNKIKQIKEQKNLGIKYLLLGPLTRPINDMVLSHPLNIGSNKVIRLNK